MIVVTGAAGFIGSCLAHDLYRDGEELILVDNFDVDSKDNNLKGLEACTRIERMEFLEKLKTDSLEITGIFHIGARTDTTEFDESIFEELNLGYSKKVWHYAVEKQIPLVYASSAATYGDGQEGFEDNEASIAKLKPLNPYGYSKQNFDLWVLEQEKTPSFFAGLKFFNVFGPNEYHKGRMASVVFHTYRQILESGGMRLFQSHNPDYKDGEQMRDFIYVKDVIALLKFWYYERSQSGIYNVGSGKARTFYDLAKAVFIAIEKEVNIGFIPTPEDIRDKYQYFTEASMNKTRNAGFSSPFLTLEEGVTDYVQNYLIKQAYF